MSPRVSICLPVLNARRFLPERIRTIREQTASDFEVVVIDGFSDDGSWEHLQSIAAEDSRFRLYQEPGRGIYPAINSAIERSMGEFIYIATADDTMTADCLERMTGALERHPECGLAHSELLIIDERGQPDQPPWEEYGNSYSFICDGRVEHVRQAPHDGLLHCRGYSAYLSLTQLLIRRLVFNQVGLFKDTWGAKGDFEWSMRASLLFATVHVPEKLATWRRHQTQATTRERIGEKYLLVMAEMVKAALRDARPLAPHPWARLVDENQATAWIYRRAFWSGYFSYGRVHRLWQLFRWLLRKPALVTEAVLWKLGGSKARRGTVAEQQAWLEQLFAQARVTLRSPFRPGSDTI